MVMVCFPGVMWVMSSVEAGARWPAFSWAGRGGYAGEVREYVRGRFGYGQRWSEAWAAWRVEGLGVSPTASVIVGREGWLFYGAEEMVSGHRRTAPMSEENLAAWAAALEARRAACAARGTRYVLLVVPEKHTVYPEQMPAVLPAGTGESRVDQFVAYVRANTGVRVVDVRAAMAEARAASPSDMLYLKHDTHWSDLGAFVAYRELMRELMKDDAAMRPREVGEFERRVVWAGGRDLASMMGLGGRLIEEVTELVPRFAVPELRRTGPYNVVAERGGEGPELFMFHGSFSERLMPMLAGHFRRAGFRHLHGFDAGDLYRDEGTRWPEVVVTEMAERNLAGRPPEDVVPPPP